MIERLVSQLPEVYQPIYGHPDLSSSVSRPCYDRLEKISGIHDALRNLLGREVRVLDLGCAQGFFSFNLAKSGASVHGVDFLDKNIDLCQALSKENPALHLSFEENRIENVLDNIEIGQYDLVLALSVFHHITHEKGKTFVKELFDKLASHAAVLVVEMALSEEPLYWAAAQPENPRYFLDSIAFVHEIGRHSTHLAPIPRPLFVASNKCWVIGNNAEYFESWAENPHAFAKGVHEGSRRYFYGKNHFLKLLRFDHRLGARNEQEYAQELRVRGMFHSSVPASALLGFGRSEQEGWLLSERIHGRLLLDLLREGAHFNRESVILSVLEQLALFEAHGLYHDDVRAWNVMIDEQGRAHVIDYGSISEKAEDCVWPNNIFLSFLIFIREVVTGDVEEPDPLRTISISPLRLPMPYQAWIHSLWKIPAGEWKFSTMYESLLEFSGKNQEKEPFEKAPMDVWMGAMEEAVQQQTTFVKYTRQKQFEEIQYCREVFENIAATQSKEINLLKDAVHGFKDLLSARLLDSEELLEEHSQSASRTSSLEAELLRSRKKLEALEQRFAMVKEQSARYERRVAAAEAEIKTNLSQIKDLNTHSHHWWTQASKFERDLLDIKGSLSWRMTAPVRGAGRVLASSVSWPRILLNGLIRKSIEILWAPLSRAMAFVLKRPRLSAFLISRHAKYPKLYGQLIQVARRGGVIPSSDLYLTPALGEEGAILQADMTSRAARIRTALEASINKKKM